MKYLMDGLRYRLAGPSPLSTAAYVHDGLAVWNKSVGFLKDPRFQRAYQRGAQSGHRLAGPPEKGKQLHIEWRIHHVLFFASVASKLEGDFVECGVNTGVCSLAVCDYLDFNNLGKKFYLFDTYCGIPRDQMSDEEISLGREKENADYYEECYDRVKRNFSEYPAAVLVRGKVPETLPGAGTEKVCYLSLDMNITAPEIAALEFFWEKLSPGAPVILDDYGWLPYAPQKKAMDEFAKSRGIAICELPTGQGVMIKPPC